MTLARFFFSSIGAALLAFAISPVLHAADSSTFTAWEAKKDVEPTADPNSPFWKKVQGVHFTVDKDGNPLTKDQTEVRARWTEKNLYLLYICSYDKLYLFPNPVTDKETRGLWNRDVAEAFIGDDFDNIKVYKEFEMSPQAEYIDLAIDKGDPSNGKTAAQWDSGYVVKAHIDEAKKIWYGEMRIPISSISRKPAAKGLDLRINLFRCQGEPADRLLLAWQPTHSPSFHVPEAFGKLTLAGPNGK